jgi:hypothetical protein
MTMDTTDNGDRAMAPLPLAARERTELRLLRALCQAVGALDATYLFRVHGGAVRHRARRQGSQIYPAVRIEVTVASWDNMRNAIGDLEGFDSDPDAYAETDIPHDHQLQRRPNHD